MFVSATTACFPDLNLVDAIDRLTDLEFTSVEIALHAGGKQLTPAAVADNPDQAILLCRDTHRLNVVSFNLLIDATGEEHYRQFTACVRLAKALKVVTLTIPSAELGTPFNEEVEHLRKLVAIASPDGIRVSIRNQLGRLSQDPDTVTVLCDNVKGLGVTLDPSHLLAGPARNKGYDQLFKYTHNVLLRDSKKDELQVRVGQGEIEYGRLINSLARVKYNRGLTVDIQPQPEVDHHGELRKIRLLLESLL